MDSWSEQKEVSWRRRIAISMAAVVVMSFAVLSSTLLANGFVVEATECFIAVPHRSKVTEIKRNFQRTTTKFSPSSLSFLDENRVFRRTAPASRPRPSLPTLLHMSSPKNFFFSVIRRRRKGSDHEEDETPTNQTKNGEKITTAQDSNPVGRDSSNGGQPPASTMNDLVIEDGENGTKTKASDEYDSNIIEKEFSNDLTKVLKVLLPDDYDDPEVPGKLNAIFFQSTDRQPHSRQTP